MATGSQGADSSMALKTSMVNTKCSFVEQANEGVVAFPLVTIFLRRSSPPLLANRFVVKDLLLVLLMQSKLGLSPMYEHFEPPLSLIP